jgi:FkbM family methyltransferase
MTVNASDLTVTLNGRTMVFPDISLLFSFAAHARFPVMQTDKPLRVVDVGGCVGGFTLAGLMHMPNATFDVIEPARACLPYLVENLSRLRGVRIYRCAASATPETLTLSYPDGFTKMGNASVYGAGNATETVNGYPLEELIAGHVDLLKIDVEGHELAVLQGAERILNESHPSVLVEAKDVHLKRAGHSVNDLFAFLMDRGYGGVEGYGNDYLFTWGNQ